jgi:hypothetical protein
MPPLLMIVLTAVPNTRSEPPDESVAPLAVPPTKNLALVPLTTVPLACPLGLSHCVPPLVTRAPIATPLLNSAPPLKIVVLTAVPPEDTKSLKSVVMPMAVPPDRTSRIPLTTVPLASPPASTFCWPKMVAPLA